MTAACALFLVALVSHAFGKPETDIATTASPLLTCAKCDDELVGCQPESIEYEECQLGTTSCMVEMFFEPNSTQMFNFRAGCSARRSCPEAYTKMMCTGFSNGIKTCRLCCFENRCHDPTPGSTLRVSVMKELMLASGFDSQTLQEKLENETLIAQNRGVTTTVTTASAVKTRLEILTEKTTEPLDQLTDATEATESTISAVSEAGFINNAEEGTSERYKDEASPQMNDQAFGEVATEGLRVSTKTNPQMAAFSLGDSGHRLSVDAMTALLVIAAVQ